MSLFDLENSRSSSEASTTSRDEGTLPICPPPPPPTAPLDGKAAVPCSSGRGKGAAPLSILEQRRRMAELDAARWHPRGARWVNELLGPSAAALKSCNTAASSAEAERGSSTCCEAGKFGTSIAAALHLRREEREKTLLKRLEQQRKAEEESIGAQALAEKDMEVGVFVTASYKALLQRNLRPTAKGSGGMGTGPQSKVKDDNDDGSSDESDGPLAAYLRHLEGTSHPATGGNGVSPFACQLGSDDYYERIMKAPLLEEKSSSGSAAAAAAPLSEVRDTAEASPIASSSAERVDSAPVALPTLAELQDLIDDTAPGSPPTPESKEASRAEAGEAKGSAKPAAAVPPKEEADDARSAVLAHARLIFDMRQAKSCRGTNDATLVAAARRCDERIGASLFASLS
ncbi:hypothetical protein LSCM1_02564 [Leishmania martiniquensis]|uniref:Uncharacterized protein n=1 Tax=Leishmania martiniquensis TaxID=1580590 RepID=A0A836G9X1_9TRYP|nr:hypothetical protein LSCM1_02564 [Leishmania martiniquensis]